MQKPLTPFESALWKTQEIQAILRPFVHRTLPVNEEMMQDASQLYAALHRTFVQAGEVMDRFSELLERR